MIDTPGHVDFTYEVSPRRSPPARAPCCSSTPPRASRRRRSPTSTSRSRTTCTIIPVLNKIDLPAAQPEKYAAELASIIGCDPDDVLRVSAARPATASASCSTRSCAQSPPPVGDADAPARAMIFDSVYDTYRGVVTYVRVIDGHLSPRERIQMMSTGATHELLEIGVISPEPMPSKGLGVGEVGYLITGVKDVRQSRVGDTVTLRTSRPRESLGGYKRPASRWSSPASTRSTAATTRRCARPWTSCSSTTPRWSTSRRRRRRSASASASASSACCTWRSSASGSSASSASTSSPPRPTWSTASMMEDGTEHVVTNPSEFPARQDRRGLRAGRQRDDHRARATTSARSWSCARAAAAALLGMDYLSEDRVELRYTLPLGRDRLRLLRRAEVPHPRLRLARLRAAPASRSPTW